MWIHVYRLHKRDPQTTSRALYKNRFATQYLLQGLVQYACSSLFIRCNAIRVEANKQTAASRCLKLHTLLSASVAPVMLCAHIMGVT